MATADGKYRILGVEHAEIITRLTAWVAGGGTPVLGTMAHHDLHFINNVGFDVQQQDVAFEGDQQSVRKFFMNGIVVNVVCDTFDLKAISEAFDKDVHVGTGGSTGIPTGVKRVYFGETDETAGVKVGLLAQIKAENLTLQTIETLQFVVPVASLTVVRPPVLAYNAKAVMNLTFTAEKTTTDIALNPLTGVPTDGTFWYLDATP